MDEKESSPSTFSLLDVIGSEVLSSDTTLSSEKTSLRDTDPQDSIPKSERDGNNTCTSTSLSSDQVSPNLEKEDKLISEVFPKESHDPQKRQTGWNSKACGGDLETLEASKTDDIEVITPLGIGEKPQKMPVEGHTKSSTDKSSDEIELERISGPRGTAGKDIANSSIDQQNTKEKIDSRSNLEEGAVNQLEDHSRQMSKKSPDQQSEECWRNDKGDQTDVTLLESACRNKDDGNRTSRHLEGKDNPTACRRHGDEVTDVKDEKGANHLKDADQTENVSMASLRSTIGRVIMIDGIKFVAVTCLQPPKGNCRTCHTFGSLLYFSARSCYILEAAEKFCSVQCARKFINEKRYHLSPSRQPSGDIGSNVSFPKSNVSRNPRDGRDDSVMSKVTYSGARVVKAENVTKSKPASRHFETLESIYVDSLVLKKVGKSRDRRKMENRRNIKKQGTYRSLTPPLPRQLGDSKLNMASKSETLVVEKSQISNKQLTSTSCVMKAREFSFSHLSSTVWKRDDLSGMIHTTGNKERHGDKVRNILSSSGKSPIKRYTLQQDHQHAGTSKHSNEREKRTTFNTSNKPFRNHGNSTRRSPSRSNTKLWKKYGTKFQSRSCDFHQPDFMRNKCDSPKPSSKGLVIHKTDSSRRSVDTGMNLNQFHERRRSLFKTMFPFQDSLGQSKGTRDSRKAKSPGEETPSETSVGDGGDVSKSTHNRVAPGSQTPILDVSETGSEAKVSGHPSNKVSHRIKHNDKRNADKPSSNWTNLFQFMMEAADREEWERRKKSNDCDERPRATAKRSFANDPVVSCKTEITSMACPESRLSGDATKVVRAQGSLNCQEKRKKKKKKKKKRKRKKEKRSRQSDVQDVGIYKDLVKEHHDTPIHGKRKGKDKRRSRPELESPSFPGKKDDPDVWPKWRGDGKKRMDMMTSIDRLIWTVKNGFQPDIGQSVNARVNVSLPTNLMNSS